MPPRKNSRHSFAYSTPDANGNLMLYGTEPYRFREFEDTQQHVVKEGDSLFTLAGKYYRGGIDRPAGLWWVIADFQPEPIHDPTIALELGRVMYIPSLRTVTEEIFSERRRRSV